MKAIVVINPSNPTGSVLSVDTIKKMIEFSVQNRLVIVADEVHNILDRCIVITFTTKIPNSTPLEKFSKQCPPNIETNAN